MVKKTMTTINKILLFSLFFKILFINTFVANADETFDDWLLSYKNFALKKGISQETIDIVFKRRSIIAPITAPSVIDII